ncbi:MAG: carbon starvation CstA family protein [Polyangiales bacterium]
MAALAALVVLACFALGYRFYARWVGTRIFGDDETIEMPSVAKEDGVDFVPTDRHVLFGHHFTSIAGAAPIVGPCAWPRIGAGCPRSCGSCSARSSWAPSTTSVRWSRARAKAGARSPTSRTT